MSVRNLHFSPELAIEILKGLTEGNELRYFRVVADALPKDATLVDIRFNSARHILLLRVESKSFGTCEDELPPPKLELVLADGCS